MLKIIKIFFFVLYFSQFCFAQSPIVIISVDGLRPDAITPEHAPTITKFKKIGTEYSNALTVQPSQTLPAHVSMLTGLLPKKHGFTWDVWLPWKGTINHPTALEIAFKENFHTVLFVTKDKLRHLERIGGSSYFERTGGSAIELINSFEYYIKNCGLPHVVFFHISEPDIAGHLHGWMSKDYLGAVFVADAAINRIKTLVHNLSPKEKATFIISADHGGHNHHHFRKIDGNRKIPLVISGPNIPKNKVRKEKVLILDIAPTILGLLGLAIPNNFDGTRLSATRLSLP